MKSSVPPYSTGGTGMKGGAIRAIRMDILERCANRFRRFHSGFGRSFHALDRGDSIFEFDGALNTRMCVENARLRGVADAADQIVVHVVEVLPNILPCNRQKDFA